MLLEIATEAGLLQVTARGEFSLPEAKRTFVEMLEAVAQLKVAKVLFDGRELTGEPEMIERFFYGEFAAEVVLSFLRRGATPPTRFAYVLHPPLRDPGRFGENVAANRGMNVKTFENPVDAVAWLGSGGFGEPDTSSTL